MSILESKAEVASFCLELSKKLDMRYESPSLPVDLTIVQHRRGSKSMTAHGPHNHGDSTESVDDKTFQGLTDDKTFQGLTDCTNIDETVAYKELMAMFSEDNNHK
jgi:hypothetical protein